MSKKHTVAIEWADGSCSSPIEYADPLLAEEMAMSTARAYPHARVWLNDEIVSRGFIASDEHNPEPMVNTHDEY